MAAISIRPQRTPDDLEPIRTVNCAAFNRHGETAAFDALRQDNPAAIISLVACAAEQIVGHVLFSPVTLKTPQQTVSAMGLGQLAVLPEYQRLGIGSRLTNAGLDRLRDLDCPFVIVVGHASYYPRFGFAPGKEFGLNCQWENIPDDSFMVLFLDSALKGQLIGTPVFEGL